MGITHRRDSFCGKMSACNNLRQYNIPYSLTSCIRESGFRRVRQGLEWFAGVCRIVKGCGTAHRSHRRAANGVQHVRYSETPEASGISVETLDLSEVLGRIGRMKDTDDAAVQKLQATSAM